MLCNSIFEDAEKDLEKVRYAQRAVGKIWRYLSDKTETTPLGKAGFDHFTTGKDEIWLFPVTAAGLPYQNVKFAVGWRTTFDNDKQKRTRAYVTDGRDSNGPFILLVVLLDHNPENDTDIAWKLDFSDLVHEFIHVMDYRRGYLTHKANLVRAQHRQGKKWRGYHSTTEQYFNSAIEFNAYYQQGLAQILNALVIACYKQKQLRTYAHAYRVQVLSSFRWFQREFLPKFDSNWLRMLSSDTKRRFVKRLYQLFLFVRAHWPDMTAIEDMMAENAEAERRFDAQNITA